MERKEELSGLADSGFGGRGVFDVFGSFVSCRFDELLMLGRVLLADIGEEIVDFGFACI